MFHSWGFWRYSKPWNLSRAEKYIFLSKASRALVHIGTTWVFVSLLCLIPWEKIQSCPTYLIKPLELPVKWNKLWVTCAPNCKLSAERQPSLISSKKQKRRSSRLHTGHRQSYFQLGLGSVYVFPSCNKEGAPEAKAFRRRQKKPLCGSAFFISQPPPQPVAFFPRWAHIDVLQAAAAKNGEKQEAEKFLLE